MQRLLLICLVCVSLTSAAAPREETAPIRIPLWTDSAEPLQPDKLRVTVDGRPAPIVRLHTPSDPLMLLIVLDLVADLSEIDLAREALLAAIREMPPNVYVAVLRAQDGLRVLLDPTTDRDAIAEAILSFPVSGRPALLETVETATQLADSILERAPVRMALLYVTDSNIYSYREDFTNPVINYSDSRDLSRRFPEGLVRDRIAKLTAKLSASQTPLFVAHLEYRTDRLNEAYQNGLMQIASVTGGQAVFCRSNAEIQPAIANTIKTILSHYGLDLQVPPGAGENVAVKVETENGNVNHRTRFRLKK